jgi:hypothetical protein
MTKQEATALIAGLTDEEVRLIRAFRKMTSGRQNEFTSDLTRLLHTQEHEHDLQECSA